MKNRKMLTEDQRKKIVDKLMEIVSSDDPNLAFRAISKLIEMEGQNQKDELRK